MVPGSTLMYGSNFWRPTERPRATRRRPIEAEAMPFPRDDAAGDEDVSRLRQDGSFRSLGHG
jgi:hypothetical protein